MKKLLYFFAFLVLVGLILYLIPVKKQTFEDLYQGEESILSSLQEFRKTPAKTLRIDGTDWTYLITGSGTKTLLFLHGMGGAYDIWWQQIEALKGDYRIISTTLPSVNSLAKATNGLLKILEQEGVEKVTVIGTSMGGYMAQYFSQQHPDKLDKLVLGNTFPPNHILKAENEGLRKWVPFIPEWVIMRGFRKNASEKVVPSSENSPLVEAYLHEQYSGYMRKKQFIGRMDVVLDYYEPKLSSTHTSIPTLIIDSDNDPLIKPELQQGLKDLYPEATVFTFEGTGHFTYLNRPEEYVDVLRDFLLN